MKQHPELIVMLTHNDCTVENAAQIFEQCQTSRAKFWGIKEKSLPFSQMRELFAAMKACGKRTVLEVVEYEEAPGILGAEMAVECGCEILMGTMFSDAVNRLCQKHRLKYMPFVGTVRDRPSVLEGTIEEMVEEARRCIHKGAFGVDLLGYRYTGDPVKLNRRMVKEVPAPICIAGSVDSEERLAQIKEASPWAFTIGSAFFEHKFGPSFPQQVDRVCGYMEREESPSEWR